MKLLEIENLKKSFEDLDVLHDISLGVEEGEVVAIIGPSGSGKSTLLRCCTGLEQADSGTIHYEGSYGLVFQNFNLFPQYTALQNVMLASELLAKEREDYRHGKREIHERIRAQAEQLLTDVGLREKMNLYPHQLSGGQQQRVAIARALALKPDVLCFDEPTSALDPELTGEVLRVIRGLADQKMTMIIVTHEMAFARDVADRVIFMDGGLIVEQGPAREVIENPREERTRRFLSRYAENSTE